MGRLRVINLFYKVKVLSYTLIFILFIVLLITIYTTQVTYPLYESSGLKILTKTIRKVTRTHSRSVINIMD